MPEGPSIVILTEQAAHLRGMRITAADGNARLDTSRLVGQTIRALRSWGKHFLIEFDEFTLRVHFLLFGSYRIDEGRDGVTPRLSLRGRKGELNLYACSLRYIDEPLDDVYDWSADIMSAHRDAAAARRKLARHPTMLACDALLDQDMFAGVGNIIKNEVCSACACIPCRHSARCRHASAPNWCARHAPTVSSSWNGKKPARPSASGSRIRGRSVRAAAFRSCSESSGVRNGVVSTARDASGVIPQRTTSSSRARCGRRLCDVSGARRRAWFSEPPRRCTCSWRAGEYPTRTRA